MRGETSTPMIGPIGRSDSTTATSPVPQPRSSAGPRRSPAAIDGMLQQRGTDQAGDAIAKRDQCEFEAIGIAIEHSAEILDGARVRCGSVARGRDQVPHIGDRRDRASVPRAWIRGLVMTAEAGQCMALQAERDMRLHAGGAGLLGEPQAALKSRGEPTAGWPRCAVARRGAAAIPATSVARAAVGVTAPPAQRPGLA